MRLLSWRMYKGGYFWTLICANKVLWFPVFYDYLKPPYINLTFTTQIRTKKWTWRIDARLRLRLCRMLCSNTLAESPYYVLWNYFCITCSSYYVSWYLYLPLDVCCTWIICVVSIDGNACGSILEALFFLI